MDPSKNDKTSKLTRTIAFRVTEVDYNILLRKIEQSELSGYLRNIVNQHTQGGLK